MELAMIACSTVCPKCQHQFVCCPPTHCCTSRRSLHALTGGGLITSLAPTFFSSNACTSPQISPSIPLTFVMPPFAQIQPTITFAETPPEAELQTLTETVRALRLSGWYYEGITYQQSLELLKDKKPGTFLVRESSDPRFLFSLSMQTDCGPASIRIHYISGCFRLDAQIHLQNTMPLFPGVVELVEHYVNHYHKLKNNSQVWVDPKGKLFGELLLDKPLRKYSTPPSLKHCARLAVHKALQTSSYNLHSSLLPAPHTQLDLPQSLKVYLSDYPYSL